MESYHKSGPQIIRSTAAAPQLAPEINIDAIASPAISPVCLMCGEGFSDRDLQELEWPLLDSPAHRACYLEHCEAYDRWNREEMRGA